MTARTVRPITLDVFSDVVCPWCFIGRQNLAVARAADPELAVETAWRPFQLDPSIPPQGVDRKVYMQSKFGSPERLTEIQARVTEAGRAAGVAFNWDAIQTTPNTFDAHRVIRWAAVNGAQAQDALVGALFRLHFQEGSDICDAAVLADAATDAAGLDRAETLARLASNEDRQALQDEMQTASQRGISGVPFFLIDGRYGVSGAQPPEMLGNALRQVAGMPAEA